MGLCCQNKGIYLCKLKKSDSDKFKLLCDVYDVKIKNIEGDNITIEANTQEIEHLKKFCLSVYNIYDPNLIYFLQ